MDWTPKVSGSPGLMPRVRRKKKRSSAKASSETSADRLSAMAEIHGSWFSR